MKRFFYFIFVWALLFVFSPLTPQVLAADIRSNTEVTVSSAEAGVRDLYLFGNSIKVDAPVENDLVAAGGSVDIGNDVSGNIMTAGGRVHIKGNVDGTIRAAGGNVVIDGRVGRDLIVAGGNVTLSKTAIVAGDLIIAGGELTIDGNVYGKVQIEGGQVWINGKVGRDVKGDLGKLTIGSQASIGGNLIYTAPQAATIAQGAVITGGQHFTDRKGAREESKLNAHDTGAFFMGFSFYKLITDILLSVVLIYFFGKFLETCIARMGKDTFGNAIYGFSFLLLVPLASVFLLIFLFPGVGLLLLYFLIIIFSVFLVKIFLGWWTLRWWHKRNKKEYVLDWKAGIIGPVLLFVIVLVPIFGWLFIAILYLISVGAVVREIIRFVQVRRIEFKKKRNKNE